MNFAGVILDGIWSIGWTKANASRSCSATSSASAAGDDVAAPGMVAEFWKPHPCSEAFGRSWPLHSDSLLSLPRLVCHVADSRISARTLATSARSWRSDRRSGLPSKTRGRSGSPGYACFECDGIAGREWTRWAERGDDRTHRPRGGLGWTPYLLSGNKRYVTCRGVSPVESISKSDSGLQGIAPNPRIVPLIRKGGASSMLAVRN